MDELNNCRHFIPLAREELIGLLCADPTLPEAERDPFRAFCDLVTATYHFEYYRRLLELKKAYAPFDPDSDTPPLTDLPAEEKQERLNDLYSDFAWLLDQAHFKHLSRDEIEPVLDSASHWGIRMDVDFSVFEHLAIFARGDAIQRRTWRRFRNLYRLAEAEVPVYQRLVLILKLRPHKRLQGRVDTENVYLKVFKDIPKLDVMMLLPGARVRLTKLDRGRIGLPLFSGLALAAWNILQDLALTLEKVLTSPNTMWGLAAGGIGYGYRSFYGYQQTKQRYHLTLTQSLYFQNLDSNAGVLTRLLDEAEEQEGRTTILAYYCLYRYGGAEGWTAAALDASMELYLDRFADVALLCKSGEALARLKKLRLVEPAGDRYRAVPLPRALEALQARWNEFIPLPANPG
jgi:Protein of unknown function (DUF3754)